MLRSTTRQSMVCPKRLKLSVPDSLICSRKEKKKTKQTNRCNFVFCLLSPYLEERVLSNSPYSKIYKLFQLEANIIGSFIHFSFIVSPPQRRGNFSAVSCNYFCLKKTTCILFNCLVIV